MAASDNPKTPVEYINNPFYIGAKGINLIFLKAQGVAILLVILSVISIFGSYRQPQDAGTDPMSNFTPEIAALVTAGALVLVVIGTFINGIMAFTAAKTSKNETVTIKQALSAVTKRFWSFLWLQILMAIKVIAWSLLFIVPGIIKSVQYSLAPLAFFDKGLKGNAAIKHSMALTKGSWITTLAGQALLTIITLGIIDLLVTTASTAVLYRQFSQTPNDQRPKPHGLSIAVLVLLVVFAAMALLALISLAFAGINYTEMPVEPGTL